MDPFRRKAKEPYNPLRPNRPPPRRTPAPSQRSAPTQRPSLSLRLASSQRLIQSAKVKEEPEPEYEDSTDWASYTLTTTKNALLSGQRYHVMRLHNRYVEAPDPDDPTGRRTVMVPEKVNISDQEMFKRPIRLHRRDATANLGGKNGTPEPVNEEEKKRLEFKAERARRREELMSKVAPDGGGRNTFRSRDQKKTQQVFQSNAAQVANRKMRYEEEYPWFIKDADGRQTWEGKREHAMSNGEFAILYLDHEKGSFSMIPVEKWYRFNKVKKGRKLTEEEIKAGEKKMTGKKEPALPSWAKKVPKEFVETEKLTYKETELYYKNNIHRRKIVMETVRGRSENMKGSEELDFNDEELFDNDDAGGVLGEFGNGNEGEEAAKDAAKRIREEQLSANVFGSRTHEDYDEEKRKTKARKFALKDHGKKVSKALKRREGNYTYDSDEEDPYINKLLSGSEKGSDSDSEAETEEFKKWKLEKVRIAAEKEAEEARKVEAKKETMKRAAEKRKTKKQAEMGEYSVAGASNSTPATPALISHAVSKPAGNAAKSRKRSRSPESQEHSIKRIRGDLAPSSSINSPLTSVSSPPPENRKKRHRSPEPERPLKPSGVLKRRRKSKISIRDTLPVPEVTNTESASPTVSKSPSPFTNITPSLLITDEEIIAALQTDPQGVAIKDLANIFKSKLKGGSNDVQALAQRLKQLGSKDGNTKRWKLKKEFF